LYFQNPKWYVKPKPGRSKDYTDNAKSAEIYLNYYAGENLKILLKKQMRLAILDAFFCFGVMKTGYTPEVAPNLNYGKPKVLGEKDGEPVYDIDEKTGEVKVDDQKEVITSDKFVSRRKSPAAMIFDIECENYFEDGRFIIEEMSMPLQDIKNNSMYENTDELTHSYKLSGGISLNKDESEREEYSLLSKDVERVTMYEIYDIEHNKIKVIAEGQKKKFLINKDVPTGMERHPYSFLQFNDVPDELYPLSDFRVMKSPQDETNKAQSLINAHAKRYGRKFAYIENMIDEAEITKAQSGEDGIMFKVKELPLNKIIEPLQSTPLDDSVYRYQASSQMNFDKLAATTEADRGAVERRKTAYEASKIYGAGDLRKEDRRSLVEDFAADVGSRLLQSMQENLTVNDAIKLGGEENAKAWVTINSREEISGQFNVGVIVGSATPKLPEYERQDFTAFMNALTEFPPELIQLKVNFDGILKAAVTMFPALEDIQLLNDEATQQKMQADLDKKQQLASLLQMRQGGGQPPMGGMPSENKKPVQGQ
jgi:hypothetical protein